MILKDFECPSCGNEFEEFVTGDDGVACTRCGHKSHSVIRIAPAVQGCDSFNPHYDIQLGRYFASRAERQAHLKEKGMTSNGPDSPRKSTKLRPICSREQAENWCRGKTNLGDGK